MSAGFVFQWPMLLAILAALFYFEVMRRLDSHWASRTPLSDEELLWNHARNLGISEYDVLRTSGNLYRMAHPMKIIPCLIFCLFVGLSIVSVALHPAVAADPLISVTAEDEPLGDVLAGIARNTGYRFNLDPEWQGYPVSATIDNLALEQGLKRLLRSLNHTIIWEPDKTVTIMVFGKADPRGSGPAVSFAAPPRAEPEEREPSTEMDSLPEEETEPAGAAAEEENRAVVSTPQAGTPEEPPGEPEE